LLYLPSVGYCMGLAICLVRLPSRYYLRNAVVGLILGAFAAQAMRRSAVWSKGSSLAASAYQAYPRSAKSLLGMGVEMRKAGDSTGARRFFHKALDIYPDYSEAESWLGRLEWERGRLPTALQHLERAVQLNTVHVNSLLFLGLTLAQMKQGARALDVLRQAHEIAPSNPEVARDFGIMLYRQGEIEASIRTLRHAGHLMAASDMNAPTKVDHVTISQAVAHLGKGGVDAYKESRLLLQRIRSAEYLPSAKQLLALTSSCISQKPRDSTQCRPAKLELPIRL